MASESVFQGSHGGFLFFPPTTPPPPLPATPPPPPSCFKNGIKVQDQTGIRIENEAELHGALTNLNEAEQGEINTWVVSKVTKLPIFATCGLGNDFNKDISCWDTGAVTSMQQTFFLMSAFNQDLNSWNTGAVTTMHIMFVGASSFNQDLNSWDIQPERG